MSMVGQTISHCKVLSEFVRGGMGVIGKAEDTKLGRDAALKFLAPHLLQDAEGRKRFLREAQAAAALDHRNICPACEIDEANGQTFLAIACLQGQTVKDKIAERPLKLEEVVKTLSELCSAALARLCCPCGSGQNGQNANPALSSRTSLTVQNPIVRSAGGHGSGDGNHMLALVLALYLAVLVGCGSMGVTDPPGLYIAPYLQNVKPDGITVMWETTDPVAGIVEYGQDGSFDRQAGESSQNKIHEVRIGGLDPGETYDYRVRYGAATLPAASFTTAPPPGTENWRFVVYGDNRSNPATHARNVEQIMKLKPNIILNSGDLVAQGSSYEQWKPQYFDPLRGVAEYIPIFPCLGNHEQNAPHYYNYHSLPGDQGEVYYSFDYANAHIISLNSNAQDAPYQRGEKQTEWLIEDLKTHKDSTWKIVFFHHPLFRSHPTRGITEQRWVWQPVFEEYGVDLVFNGHDHYYMRANPIGRYTGEPRRGLFHLISGGGGANTYPMVPKPHAAFRRRVHHVTAVDVMGDRLIGRAVDIDGKVFDAFVVDKQAVNSAEEFIAYEVFELERDLGQKIREMPPVTADERGAEVDTVLEVANPFNVPIDVAFRWQGTNGWTVEPETSRFRLDPGTPLRLPIRAKGDAKILYPIPAALIEFSKLDGEKAFRNDRVEFYPLKVGRDLTIKVAAADTRPTIDGKLNEAVWRGAEVLGEFVDVQGTTRPTRPTSVRLLHSRGVLFVAATVEVPEELTTQFDGRDNQRLVRDDHVRVNIGVGGESYSFAVNASGSLLDTKGADTAWNSSATAAAVRRPQDWQAEMAIPLDEIASAGAALRINLSRLDQTANRQSELLPTFGSSELDHQVPTYRSDPLAVGRFARLVLE